MTAVVNAIKSIVDILSSLISFVISFIQDLVNIAQILAKVMVKLPGYLSFVLPSTIFTVLVVGITVAVVYKIAGRE